MKLPYPGYTWTINQHNGPAANENVIVPLLKAAFFYSTAKDYREKITNRLVSDGILTPNFREDQNKPQAWRDYQQVLPELGLIVSTKYTQGVELTPVGLLLIDGYISYQDIVASQVLKMQYPNGFKQDISPQQKKLLSQNGSLTPSSLTVLQLMNQIQIKPAVLILRILIEFLENGQRYILSRNEVAKYLLPISRQNNWREAYEAIVNKRSVQFSIAKYVNRHIAEWFRLLSLSWMFSVSREGIQISNLGIENYGMLAEACEFHEKAESFWVPNDDADKYQIAFSWFSHFGSALVDSQFMVGETILEEDDTLINRDLPTFNPGLSLLEYPKKHLEIRPKSVAELSDEEIENRRKGKEILKDKTRFHDLIVDEVAQIMQGNGYTIFEDRSSADLIALKNNEHILFEIKTTTKKNIKKHIRLGNAQLLEYRYRVGLTSSVPKTALVLSGTFNYPDWMINFIDLEMNHSLIGRQESMKYLHHTQKNIISEFL
jgi:hypothetical protein